ncbi:MAG: Rhomboid family intrarane serine protease [Nocardioides sp.]|jgi:membrane associated rhomboid family serine protease|nr:Rhomboid family intrarane serine protease [Nocardioides sp.]
MSATTPPESAAGVPICYRHAGRETWIRCQRCERPICPDCMRDASVGFQCPSCVKEGSKQTRSGRATYGGRRSDNPTLTSNVLIGVNVAVWLAVLVTGFAASQLVDLLGLLPRGRCDAPGGGFFPGAADAQTCALATPGTWVPGVADGAFWQLVTSQFLHVQPWHIAANMLALWSLGPEVERSFGRARFLALYLLSGLAGSVAVLWFSAPVDLTLGASGAIYGLFGAIAVITFKVKADLRSIGVLLAINVFITFAVPNISWQGHLGGLLGGAAIAAIIVYSPRARRTQIQVLGLVGITALLAALIALRIDTLG